MKMGSGNKNRGENRVVFLDPCLCHLDREFYRKDRLRIAHEWMGRFG